MWQYTQIILETLGYVFAAIGLFASVYRAYLAWRSITRLTWDDVDNQTKKLIKKIGESEYEPDIVVTVGRGGAIVGSILSGNLPSKEKKTKNVPILGADRLYRWEDGMRIEIENKLIDFSPLKGQKVLLVAGDVLTGGTMKFFHRKIEAAGVAELRCACLLKGITATFKPEYFAKEIPADFETPWMYKGYGYSRDSRKPNQDAAKPTLREKWQNRIA